MFLTLRDRTTRSQAEAVGGPATGLIAVTDGRVSYVNRSAAEVALVPTGVVTVTSTMPADAAGDVAVIWVESRL